MASTSSAATTCSPPKENCPMALALQRAKRLRSIAAMNSTSALAKEMDYYERCAQNIVLGEDFDVFAFWAGTKNEFIPGQLPIMASVAPDVLAIPASTAPLERIFSQIGQVIGFNRHRIADGNMAKETFIRCNKQYLYYDL